MSSKAQSPRPHTARHTPPSLPPRTLFLASRHETTNPSLPISLAYDHDGGWVGQRQKAMVIPMSACGSSSGSWSGASPPPVVLATASAPPPLPPPIRRSFNEVAHQ
ncbi:hypothetical protein VPH35_111009 [Triticum aestivum]